MPKLPGAFDTSCSRLSHTEQLKSVVQGKLLREKWKENTGSSSKQDSISSESEAEVDYFQVESQQEEVEAENWVEDLRQAVSSEIHCSWVSEWQNQSQSQQLREELWNNEYENSWTEEFETNKAESWISEFKQQNESPDSEQLAESAAELLSRLDMNDEKLRNSQFVAYLQKLSNGQSVDPVSRESALRAQESFNTWREEFRRAIDPLVSEEDATWETWKKDWEQYAADGNGYEGFAFREFRRYQFASNNPYLSGVALSPSSLRERILELEVNLQRKPSAALWAMLGSLQSENEMDIQAIAAYQEALRMNSNFLSAWFGLALSCLNERCIPDTYEAIENWIRRNPSFNFIPVHNVQADNRNSELLRCLLSSPSANSESDALILISVLQNLGSQPEQAVVTLQRALNLEPLNPTLLNRLGATLANLGRYAEALSYYEQALSNGFDNPRLHYNRAVSLMSINRYSEAQFELVQAIQLQLPVSNTQNVRPDLRAGYQSIWNTLRLLCELMGNDDLAFEAEMGNLTPFL